MSDTTLEKVHNALDKLSTAIHALDSIEAIAKSILGDEAKDAFEAMHVIAMIVDAVRGGFEDRITVSDVEDEILDLRKSVTSNDEAADQTLNDKFDKSEP